MKNNSSVAMSKLWAYVHKQLSEEESSKMRGLIESDEELRREFKAIQETDRLFRSVSSRMNQTEDALDERVLQAWEALHAQDSGMKMEGEIIPFVPPVAVQMRSKSWWRQGRLYLRAAAGIAACFMVAFGLRNYYSSPLEWEQGQVQTLQYRGAEGVASVYSKGEMELLSRQLRETIMKGYKTEFGGGMKRSFLRKNTSWILVTKLQELPARSLYVQVEAYDSSHRTLAREWSTRYMDSQSFSSEMEGFGYQVAKDLISLNTKPGAI